MQFIKVKKYTDAIYFGQVDMVNQIRHGAGIMKYRNGRLYEGRF